MVALALSLLYSVPLSAATDPISISCPNGQSVRLTGTGAPPYEALLVQQGQRSIGGGSSDARGDWNIPITFNDRPGIYELEVITRKTRAIQARFNCYVDVVLDIEPTPTPTFEPVEGRSPVATSQQNTVTPTQTLVISGPEGTTIPGQATPTVSTTTTATTPTNETVTTVGTTVTAETPSTTVSPSVTTTTSEPINTTIRIDMVACRDPYEQEGEDTEYISIENTGRTSVDLTGWYLLAKPGPNTERMEELQFTFPEFEVNRGPDLLILIYSNSGENPLPGETDGDFYWGENRQIWHVDDIAELYDSYDRQIDTYTVAEDTCY